MENNKKFRHFKAKEGEKFLNYIACGRVYADWEFRTNCFMIWSGGLLAKREGDINYSFILGRGWVAY